MSDKNWERLQKEKEERLNRYETNLRQKQRAEDLRDQDEGENTDMQQQADSYKKRTGNYKGLFKPKNEPNSTKQRGIKSIKKAIKNERNTIAPSLGEKDDKSLSKPIEPDLKETKPFSRLKKLIGK